MLTFLRTRLPIFAALVFTILALYGIYSRQSFDSQWMLRTNHVDSGQVQLDYVVLIVVLLLALPFAPRIQRTLQRGRVFVFMLVAVVSFLSIGLLERSQEHRLFITPFSIWIVIAHIIAMAALAVWVALPNSAEHSEHQPAWFRRWFVHQDKLLVGFYIAVIGLLIVVHVASVGEFMYLDIPDEPWLGSIATNYAENNDFSPTFTASPDGRPDFARARYYWLMGIFAKTFGSSLTALRTVPLLVMGLIVILTGTILWHIPHLTLLQRLGGLIVLLSVSAAVRASHSLRGDIGLGLYGGIMLAGTLYLFSDSPHRRRWVIISGLMLYIGLESIPFIALILAAVTGLMFMAWLIQQRRFRFEWRLVVLYGICCALSLALYVAVRFLPYLPDIQTQLSGYGRFATSYSQGNNLGNFHSPFNLLINYLLRFSLILSPIEFIVVTGALVVCWRWGTSAQRWLLMTFILAFVIAVSVTGFAFGYGMIFVPLVAYAAACALRSRRIVLLSSFVLMPALIAAPVDDLLFTIQTRPNETYLSSLDELTPHVPTGITIIGENAFWFTLHFQRYFIGVEGFRIYSLEHPGRTQKEQMQDLDVDALLCDKNNESCNDLGAIGLFTAPETYVVNNSTYLFYKRLPS